MTNKYIFFSLTQYPYKYQSATELSDDLIWKWGHGPE